MAGSRREVAGALMVLGAGFCWGTSGTLQAFAPAGAAPVSIGAARVVGTAIILMSFTLFRNARRFFCAKWRPGPVLLGGFALTLYQVTFFKAAPLTGAGVAAIIAIGLSPAMAGAMARLLFGEQLSRRWYVSTAIAVAGCALLSFGGNPTGGSSQLLGILLAVIAGFAYSLEGVAIKMLGGEHEPFDVTSMIFLASGFMGLPILVSTDCSWLFSLHGLIFVLMLAGFSSALGFVIFTRGLLVVGVARSYTLGLSEPLTAWILSTTLLGQKLAPLGLVGGAAVLSAILILAYERAPAAEEAV